MDDEKLDYLLSEMFEQERQVDMKLVYRAKNKARSRLCVDEHKQVWYPFILVILMNVLLVLIEIAGLIFIADNLKQVTLIISIGLWLMQLPIMTYLLSQIYYKEKE